MLKQKSSTYYKISETDHCAYPSKISELGENFEQEREEDWQTEKKNDWETASQTHRQKDRHTETFKSSAANYMFHQN